MRLLMPLSGMGMPGGGAEGCAGTAAAMFRGEVILVMAWSILTAEVDWPKRGEARLKNAEIVSISFIWIYE